MLTFWLHGCLWLMSDLWGSRYLEEITKPHFGNRSVSESAYTKSRQKLGLKNWEVAYLSPRIIGFQSAQRKVLICGRVDNVGTNLVQMILM